MRDAPLESVLRDPMVRAAIYGVSLAVLRQGEITLVDAFGCLGPHDEALVDTETVFEATSLTKPLVSFMALQLAEEGKRGCFWPKADDDGCGRRRKPTRRS